MTKKSRDRRKNERTLKRILKKITVASEIIRSRNSKGKEVITVVPISNAMWKAHGCPTEPPFYTIPREVLP